MPICKTQAVTDWRERERERDRERPRETERERAQFTKLQHHRDRAE